MNFLKRITRNRYLFVGDMLMVCLCYLFASVIVYRVQMLPQVVLENWRVFVLSALVFLGFLQALGCYRVYWVYGGTKDYCRILVACLCASLVSDIICQIYDWGSFYLKANILASGMASVCILALRMGVRVLGKVVRVSVCESQRQHPKNIIIVGAGSLGVTLVKDISGNEALNYHIMGFIDDDSAKKNAIIYGVKVLGTTADLKHICEWLNPDEIIIAISSASAQSRQRIINLCSETQCKLKILPGIADTLRNRNSVELIREVEVEDLLEREPIRLDNSAIAEDITGQVVLVTGGGGSIGSELCRQIARFSPKKLVVLDIYENNAFDLENELADKFPDCDVEVVIASVRDKQRLETVFASYHPHIVFHAAAHKHVPLMEFNAMEAVKNNVFGTYNTACCAGQYGAKRFVLISTDKAVNPTNVMGATKRICEMVVQAMQTVSRTEFVAVRFGNVLNSNGSVLPRLKKQIKNGGPITVTHKEITRFFMTIPEAAQLVLQAATYAKGGEIFVLDMGEPVKIYDLAKNLVRLSGLKLGTDINIEITGLRPGEKLYEELLMNEEGLKKTAHNKIFIGEPFFESIVELEDKLKILKEAIRTEDNEVVKNAVAQVVPTYVRPEAKPSEEPEKMPERPVSHQLAPV